VATKLAYKRALLKLSGEAFAGGRPSGIDFGVIERLSDELKQVAATGVQLGLVIGGGNILRGATASEQGMDRVSADYMGMPPPSSMHSPCRTFSRKKASIRGS